MPRNAVTVLVLLDGVKTSVPSRQFGKERSRVVMQRVEEYAIAGDEKKLRRSDSQRHGTCRLRAMMKWNILTTHRHREPAETANVLGFSSITMLPTYTSDLSQSGS